ncbi:hypothetical protein SAMN05216298_1975 [Glycomyces sambucus]|uniref:Uncharacterized protein n=1 Tax=Glycomyces sambucus TaxID=380244 RepID=A0A1G9FS04_9ACTN|nr:hypothetical protein [Glycomyces sambucus]SDK90893.1 hypothetical protein SAMN05216298_1975 [Glycomyces sambucus]
MNTAFARTLRVWLLLLLALLVVQFALAGFGVGYGGGVGAGFRLHFVNGDVLLFGYAAAVVLALAARPGARIVRLTVLGTVLVLLQHAMGLLSVPGTVWGQSLFFFHALNGLALIFLTFRTGRLVRDRLRERAAQAAAAR